MRAIVQEIVGLFVDDGFLAAGLVAWIAVITGMRAFLGGSTDLLAPGFAAGCVAILIAAIARAARG